MTFTARQSIWVADLDTSTVFHAEYLEEDYRYTTVQLDNGCILQVNKSRIKTTIKGAKSYLLACARSRVKSANYQVRKAQRILVASEDRLRKIEGINVN